MNHWMAAKLAARFGADIGLPDLLVALGAVRQSGCFGTGRFRLMHGIPPP